MPCTFTGSLEGDRAMLLEEALDELTDLLCSMLQAREAHKPLPPKVVKWWKEHKESDKKLGR